MHFTTLLTAACSFAVLASATATPETQSACGWPNGNCYENGCKGELSSNKVTCTAGPYKGCQCGYNCGKKTGQCDANGCAGRNNRCTRNYLGCSCLGP